MTFEMFAEFLSFEYATGWIPGKFLPMSLPWTASTSPWNWINCLINCDTWPDAHPSPLAVTIMYSKCFYTLSSYICTCLHAPWTLLLGIRNYNISTVYQNHSIWEPDHRRVNRDRHLVSCANQLGSQDSGLWGHVYAVATGGAVGLPWRPYKVDR